MKQLLTVTNIVILVVILAFGVLLGGLLCNKPKPVLQSTEQLKQDAVIIQQQQQRIQALIDSNATLLRRDSLLNANNQQQANTNEATRIQQLQEQLKQSNEKINRILTYGSDSLRRVFAEEFGH